jgi:hypothetical protein
MGYLSRLVGRIQIDPPLRWSEFKDSPYRKISQASTCVVLDEQAETVDTDDGVIERRYAIGLVPRQGADRLTYYDLEEHLAGIEAEHGLGHAFSGYLLREGDEQGDVERYWLADEGGVRSEKAKLRWTDGTAVYP